MSFTPPTPKQAGLIWFAVSGLAIAILATLAVALIWGLGKVLHILAPVLWPLAVAGVVAYLLDPVVDFFQKKGLPRTRSILCVFGLGVVLLLGIAGNIVPHLVTETQDLALRIPTYARNLRERTEAWVKHPPRLLEPYLGRLPGRSADTNRTETLTAPPPSASANPTNSTGMPRGTAGPAAPDAAWDKSTIDTATDWLAKSLPQIGTWIFGQFGRVASWFGVLAGLALIPVYTFYFLNEKQGISSKWTDYLPVTNSAFKDELVFVLRSINGYLIVFFRSQVLVAICDGALYTIGFLLIGLPYALLLGVLAIGLTLIPFLGAMATCTIALILAFVQYGDWKHPSLVLAVFGVVQTLEGLVISPRILGDRVGLHPLTIIVAVMVGTTLLGGVLGGILAIPLTAAGRVLMFRYVWKKPEA